MQLRDTTAEANNQENMANYYLYHSESANNAWGLAVEQVEADAFNVCVLYKEPDWDMYGVIRYWTFDDRAMAEARYLELQTLLRDVEESVGMKELLKTLPETERHAPRE